MLRNIVIQAVDNGGTSYSIVVRADSDRFGKNAIMYQDITFMACCKYIARATGRNDFKLKARAITASPTMLTPDMPYLYAGPPQYTDFEGRTMPAIMDVVF